MYVYFVIAILVVSNVQKILSMLHLKLTSKTKQLCDSVLLVKIHIFQLYKIILSHSFDFVKNRSLASVLDRFEPPGIPVCAPTLFSGDPACHPALPRLVVLIGVSALLTSSANGVWQIRKRQRQQQQRQRRRQRRNGVHFVNPKTNPSVWCATATSAALRLHCNPVFQLTTFPVFHLYSLLGFFSAPLWSLFEDMFNCEFRFSMLVSVV